MFNCTTAGHESRHGLSNPLGQSLREKNELHHQPSAAVQPAGGDDIIMFLRFKLSLDLFGNRGIGVILLPFRQFSSTTICLFCSLISWEIIIFVLLILVFSRWSLISSSNYSPTNTSASAGFHSSHIWKQEHCRTMKILSSFFFLTLEMVVSKTVSPLVLSRENDQQINQ